MLFVPYPAFGHVLPMVPVIEALVARGVRVRVVVDRRYAGLLEGVGAEVIVPWGRADVFVPAWVGGPGTVRYLVGRVRKRVVGLSVRRVLSGEIARRRPEVVVLSSVERGRVRFVGPLRRAGGGADLAGLGLPRDGRVLLVSPGTVFAWTPGYLRATAWAFAGSGWWVVMATGAVDPGRVGSVPENVMVRRFVPQPAVLAKCSAFLTHAGMNSVLEALAAGVSMVVRPRAGDQRVIARRLVELGLAVRAPRAGALVPSVVEGLVGDPRVRSAAAGMRDRLAGRATVDEAADLLAAQLDRGPAH